MSKRILVVEDQDDLRGVLRDLLTGSGYTVIEADGEVGVAKAQSEHPEPHPDGHSDACDRWLRGHPVDKNRCRAHADTNFFTQTGTPAGCVRYVAVSSSAMKGDEEKARAAGCDHYVTKPYSPMQLLRLIRGFLGDKA